MAYKITFTKRFVRNVKRLSAAERTQLKKKLELLMQDPLYRSYVAHRSMGYPQAPVPSFYLGE